MKKRATYSRLMQSTNWQKIRRSVLRETPLCADCLENGINTSATEIHHIRPVRQLSVIRRWNRFALTEPTWLPCATIAMLKDTGFSKAIPRKV